MTARSRDAAAAGHLAVLAREPRPAGGDADRRAQRHCSDVLEQLGFAVVERPFSYSTIPGRWATSGSGILCVATLAAAAWLGHAGHARAAGVLLVGVLAVLALAGTWLARHGTVRLGAGRASAVNLEARPRTYEGVREPTVWLVAHTDSKSQPVPMLLRAGGIMLTALVWAAMLVLAAWSQLGGAAESWWLPFGAAGAIAALPIAASTVGARSAGALDNASGVASVLGAAALVPRELPVGVLLTSAEELGLAGARAWVAARGRGTEVLLNCDGVDDGGTLVLMYSGRRPDRLLAVADRVCEREGIVARARRLVPGVLVDAVAFADAGHETVTVSRGTPRTLARIHRPSDDLAHLRGAGVGDAARLLAGMAITLVET